MAVKKRVSLREKSVRKSLPVKRASDIVVKRKILDKTIIRDPTETGISKSAIRRRKRKLREDLPGKFTGDMLQALTTSTNTVIQEKNGVESISIGKSTVKLDHRPKATNSKGEKVISKIENARFKQVLKSQVASNGLRDAILLNMSKFKE